MVDEACQSTGLIYAGSSYNSSYGSAVVQIVEISPVGAHNQLCNITTPWGSTHNSEVLEYEVLKTYSRSITGGTEYYTLYCTFVVYSESSGAIYTECWWTDDGNRYVKTTGSDSALGNNWANAWLTMGYGFQNIPSGKDLYVEEGLYGGETLSNLNPPQTMSVYIQPSGHTEAQCNVWVSDDTVFADGSFSDSVVSNMTTNGITVIDPFQTITAAGVINAFSYLAANVGVRTGKLKIYRDDGTNYNFIGESELFEFTGSIGGIRYDYNKCNVTVQSGDIIGIYINNGYVSGNNIGSNYIVYKSGDIITDELKSAWTTSGSLRTPLKVGVRGFK